MSDSDDSHAEADDSNREPLAGKDRDETSGVGRRHPADEVTVREGRNRGRGSAASDQARRSSEPRKRGRKRSRRGRSGPAFLASFPKDPALSAVVAAFERGDYAAVRQQAAQLARHAESKRVRQAARELLYRVEPDPLAKLLLAAAFALLLFLVIWAYAAH